MDEAAFLTDKKTQNAVLYNITIIGEAVKKLTPDFREQHPQIPWKQIAGMRDKLVHDYRQINLKQVWLVTQIDIPELLNNLHPLLPQNPLSAEALAIERLPQLDNPSQLITLIEADQEIDADELKW
jgi:uncharacterized protein with HEPN domain